MCLGNQNGTKDGFKTQRKKETTHTKQEDSNCIRARSFSKIEILYEKKYIAKKRWKRILQETIRKRPSTPLSSTPVIKSMAHFVLFFSSLLTNPAVCEAKREQIDVRDK